MHPLPLSFSSWTSCMVFSLFAAQASAYFIVTNPTTQTQWANNAVNLVTWTKGVLDGVNSFDLEMSQMSVDGLTLIARNVPASQGQLNLMLQDVPAGNDYYLLFVNSTIGVMYTASSQFTILAASQSPSSTNPSPAAGVPTVTISGGPYPTLPFATTFPAIANGAVSLLGDVRPGAMGGMLLMTFLGCLFGALWTIGW